MTQSAYTLKPIGYVASSLVHRASAPKQGHEGAPSAWLVFDDDIQEGLRDLLVGDDVIVLTWLDRGSRETLRVYPRGDRSQGLVGVFSTRSPDRPNPIGLHRVRILTIAGARLQVDQLEALDQTPIIDLKPVLETVTDH